MKNTTTPDKQDVITSRIFDLLKCVASRKPIHSMRSGSTSHFVVKAFDRNEKENWVDIGNGVKWKIPNGVVFSTYFSGVTVAKTPNGKSLWASRNIGSVCKELIKTVQKYER